MLIVTQNNATFRRDVGTRFSKGLKYSGTLKTCINIIPSNLAIPKSFYRLGCTYLVCTASLGINFMNTPVRHVQRG